MFQLFSSCSRKKSTPAPGGSLSEVRSPLLSEPNSTSQPKTDYDITVLTYNVGNENPHKDVAQQLKDAITSAGNDPDIIIIALQEAKSSRILRQNLAERILKRFTDENSKQGLYTLMPGNSALALTCPHPGNWENLSYTHLVVAYKTTRFPLPHHINIIHQGKVVTKKRDHKGGLYSLLSIRGTILGVISVHLDSFDTKKGQQQAEALIIAAQCDPYLKGRKLSGIIMAGDFNTRFDPLTLAVKPSETFVIDKDKALNPGLTQYEASRITTDLWQRGSAQLQKLSFISPLTATVTQPHLVRNLTRTNDRWDYGVLDPVAFADYTEAKNVLVTATQKDYPIAEIVRPRARTATSLTKQEISDHAAVIARLKVAPPALALEEQAKQTLIEFLSTTTELQAIHDFLVKNNNPALFRAYFEYAIAAIVAKTNVGTDYLPYHFEDDLNECLLIKKDITFIINHLDALLDQDFDIASYNLLIYKTCLDITLFTEDGMGCFMLEVFEQLLASPLGAADTGSTTSLRHFLRPFRKWLDNEQLNRACYTVSDDGSLKRLGFFHHQVKENKSFLPAEEQKKLR